MRYLLATMFLACAPDEYYAPQEQDFESFGSWGDGIPGFEITTSGPTDTGNGGGNSDVDGVYLGTYSVEIQRESYGDTCVGSASLTMAVEEGEIRVGQGSQISLDCGEFTSMRFRGFFDEFGLVSGEAFEESSFNVQTVWTGVFSNGVLAGNFSEYLSSDQGMITLSGTVNVTKN